MLTYVLQRVSRSVARRRSVLLKAVGYRVLSVVVTVAIAFAVVGNMSAALDIGIWANVLKTGVYYAYERAWAGVDVEAVWTALTTAQ